MAGKYKVVIHAGGGKSSSKGEPPGPTGTVTGHQVPPEYNTESKQVVEVKDGEPNEFNFKIPKRKG